MNIKQAIEKISLKDLIESTGRVPASGNIAKGEYTYSAPYREDNNPSLKINTYQKRFIDYGQPDAKGDVIQLARLIMGNGNASSITVSEALQWLKKFSGSEVAVTPAMPLQQPEKRSPVVSVEGERFKFIQAVPFTKKAHPNTLDYVLKDRKIGLAVASRYLDVVTYMDTAARGVSDKGWRYGVGSQNDAGGWEVRAASSESNFKTSLGQKEVTTFIGDKDATTGDIFEGQFDFLTSLELRGKDRHENPTIILNTGRFASRAAELIMSRPEWQNVKNWNIWQHNDDEGDRTTQVICMELGGEYTVGTLNFHWHGYKDLNKWWTDAPAEEIDQLRKSFSGQLSQPEKFYDSSMTAQIRRNHERKLRPQ